MDSGEIPLILGGEVKVLGMTPAEAAHAIERVLIRGNFVLNPHASVTIERYTTKNVTVLGQVRAPGSYDIGTPRSILEVISLAGGLTDAADRKITIERRETKEQTEYFLSNNSATALKDVPLVFPGDSVLVPKASFVYVLGDVGRPGGYPASTNDSQLSALQAIAFAGGMPPNAAPAKAQLIRKAENGAYVEIPLQLKEMQHGKRADLALKADDVIYVPFSYLRNVAVNINSLIAAAASASIYRIGN
jgi:polysaccharide export outer membrane protein